MFVEVIGHNMRASFWGAQCTSHTM